jgi:hypothetical protein
VPQNDDHFATAELRVKNKGNSTISSASLSVIAYDQSGRAYSSSPCDNNIVGDAYENLHCASGNAIGANPDVTSLSPGEVFTYCLAFIVPDSADVSEIEVSGIVGSGSGYNKWAFIDTFKGWTNQRSTSRTASRIVQLWLDWKCFLLGLLPLVALLRGYFIN